MTARARVRSGLRGQTAAPSRKGRAATGALLLVLPALLTAGMFFFFPVARLLLQSAMAGGPQHLYRIASEPVYRHVFLQTLLLAAYVTAGCLIPGYVLAHFLATAPRRLATLGFALILLPLWTSVLVRTYAWMILLGRNGIVNRSLMALGLIDSPVPFMYNTLGVVIAMVHVLLPLAVLPLYAVLRRIDPNLLKAGASLGANAFQVFRYVYLPLSLPGLFAGSFLTFILSIGFYITPAIMGGGRVITLAVLIEQQARRNLDFAGVLSAVMLLTALLVYWAYSRVLREGRPW